MTRATEHRTVSQEYDRYDAIGVLDRVGRTVFGDDYVGQKSSLWPATLLDAVRATGIGPEHSVLDAGCGGGWASVLLAAGLGCRTTGWDVSEANVAAARRAATGLPRCTFARRDMTDPTGHDGAFDLVLAVGSLYWCDDPDRLVRAWRTLLAPGASVLTFLTRTDGGDPSRLRLTGTSDTALTTGWAGRFAEAGFTVTVRDRTTEFRSWLAAWLDALDRHDRDLRAVMGDGLPAFRARFTGMAEQADAGLLRRDELRAVAPAGATR